MPSTALLLALLAGAAPAAQPEAPPADPRELRPSSPQELELPAGAVHTWTVALEAGRAYRIEVEQLDTYLELRWTAGEQKRRVNDRPGRTGREELFWVADTAGPATLTVGSTASRPGRYRIALAAPVAATSQDRDRHRAEMDASRPDPAARRAAADRFGGLGLVHRQVRTLDRLSYLAASQGDFGVARQAAEECALIARGASMDEPLASCLCALANVAQAQGDLDLATESYREAIALREQGGDPALVATALADSAGVFALRGEYDEADARRRRVLELARELGDETMEAITRMNMAAIASFRGRTEEALAAFESGREVAKRRANRRMEAVATLNAGVAYGNLGAIDRAIARLQEAIAIAEAEGLKPTVALARLGLGAEHDDAGDLDVAQREMEAGVAIAREIGDGQTVANGEALLGWVLARRGRPAEAEKHLDAAVAAAAEVGSREYEATAYLYQGKARLLAGRLDEADASLQRASAMFRELGRVDDQGRASLALGELARARGDLAGALSLVSEAVERFESVRARVALADQRARYFAFRREAYDLAVAILVERDRLEPGRDHLARAFEMTERARGRTLVEELAARRAGASEAPRALVERHGRAMDRIGHLQREMIQARTSARPDAAALARLERDIAEAVSEEEAARREIRAGAPGAWTVEPEPTTAADHARRLAADEAIVEYHVGQAASWLFVVTRAGLTVAKLPGVDELRRQVHELRERLAQPRTLGAAAYASAARRAYDVLLRPALGSRPTIRRLRIVPDGPLWEIPFEALVTSAGSDASYATLPYVVKRYTVAYQAAAAATPRARTGAGNRPDLVAFADPLLPDQVPDREPVARLERAVFREGDRWSLSRLPCAQTEARDAAAVFGPGRASVHLGDAARESRVKSDVEVGQARYLLFSTHALLSETLPSQSALVLSLGGDGREDGLLQVHEIDGLALEADLVVLSACESALGENVRGEGLLGLARAFFHAGARQLVASLWKVADCSAAEVSRELFRRLRGQGEPDVAEALRRAKLRLLARPGYAHPYHWAPFVLVG